MTYAEKLADPRWQKKRLEILERDGNHCTNCGEPKTSLQVHHLYYEWGVEPWEYPDDAMQTLCEQCHEIATLESRRLNAAIRKVRACSGGTAYLSGFLEACIKTDPECDLLHDLSYLVCCMEGMSSRDAYLFMAECQRVAQYRQGRKA